MTITEPMDGKNPPDNLICPRCGTSLPLYTTFCSACGRRVKKKNKERIAYPENGDAEAHKQETDDTVHISSLKSAHMKHLQSDQSLNNNVVSGQASKSSPIPYDVEAQTTGEPATSSTPVPDIDTQKNGSIPLSHWWEQQITKPVSIANAAHQQIVNMLGSNEDSVRRSNALMESTNPVVGIQITSDETPTVPLVSDNNSAATVSLSKTWGWLPELSVISGFGVFLIALAYNAGRVASQWAESLFWLGLLVLFLPIAVRLFSPKPRRRERIALLAVLGVLFYFVKFLQYPLYFAYFDEFTHTRTAQDIIVSGHLFQPNPILAISPLYPGLEIVTTALSSLTGLSLFASGTILIGLVQLIIVLSLYLFYEYFTKSAHIAGIATVLYMANPGFLFDMDFAYESLALSLTLFFLFVHVIRCYRSASRYRGLSLAIWLVLGAIVITHHLTSYALVTFLLLWTVLFLLLRAVAHFRRNRAWKDRVGPSPGGVAFLGLVLCIAWLTYTGGLAASYLSQYPIAAIHQLIEILSGESAPRQLFQSSGGLVIPLWERVMSYASVVAILLGLPFGLFQIWRRHRTNTLFLALAGAALAYPASLVFRLTAGGAEGSQRASEFVFVGVAIVLALGITTFWLSRASHWLHSVIIMSVVGVILIGQMIVGNGQIWSRMPGPYLVVADNRSIEPEGIAAAKWAGTNLGPGQRIATDRTNMLLMTTYGNEWNVDNSNADDSVSSVFTSLQLGQDAKAILQQDRIQYLVVDRRLSTALPQIDHVFDILLPDQLQTKPIDPAALAKFNGVPNVSRVFDSGDIIIYNVEPIANGTSTSPTPPPQLLCAPASSTTTSNSYPKIAKNYTGTTYDISTGRATNISLSGIQQKQGAFCGSLGGLPTNTHTIEIPSNGPFKGTVTTAGQIQFILTSSTGQPTVSFIGVILPDGGMSGTYCSPGVDTEKCSDYGLWSVAPARSG